jgi:hypothetical protein
MRRLAIFAVTAVAAMLPATASASAPERYDIDFVVSDTIDCSQFNPDWTFNDEFTDFFTGRGQRPGAGEVIHISGHKVLDLETGEPIVIHGPDTQGNGEDFCAAVAP